jgi:hypothetical protein
MIFSAINTDDMEDMVYGSVVKNELDGNEDRWEDEEWGFL